MGKTVGIATSLGMLGAMLVFLAAARAGAAWAPPPEWLTGWTTWILTALSAVLAPLALKDLSAGIHAYMKREGRASAPNSAAAAPTLT
jgi:hypothetical protein